MRLRDCNEVSHAFDFRTFHRNLAVVGIREILRQKKIDGCGACYGADFVIHRTEPRRKAIVAGAELYPCWSIQELVAWQAAQIIDNLTALVWRRQHDDAAEI